MAWQKQKKGARRFNRTLAQAAAEALEPRWLFSTVSFTGDSGMSFSLGSQSSGMGALPVYNNPGEPGTGPSLLAAGLGFQATYLVSDTPGLAANTDADLINPWGVATVPFGPFWIADNNGGVSTVYNSNGETVQPPVGIPQPAAATGGPATGVVYHGTNLFKIGGLATTFLFATEQGTIAGWTGASNAVIAVDRSSLGAVYKGLAIGASGLDTFLYATNFNSGRVDVFNGNFSLTALSGTFTDPNTDLAEGGYAPFNINNINGQLYVTYAKQDADKENDVGGAGNGIVDIFNTDGIFVKRLITGGVLDSPWGMAIAPQGFGSFTGDLLIGNFKDGRINAFDQNTGAFLGTLTDTAGNAITIPGLWDLQVGNGASGGVIGSLYFTAGFDSEQHGLFGALAATNDVATATTTVLSSDNLQSQQTELTAVVTGANRGLVSFEENGTLLGSVSLDNTGHASITTTLGIGLHHVTATFSGPGNAAGSTSAILDVHVADAAFNEAYVNQIYADLLGRTPDANGLSYWTSVLNNGGSAHDLTVGITSSTEYLSIQVQGFYQGYLGRAADAAGLNNWVLGIQAGGTVEQVQNSILGSEEYFNRAGGTSEAYVTQLFHDTLGRPPEPEGLNAWVSALDAGQLSRTDVAVQINGSEESRNTTVNRLYEELLRRPADPGGLAVWSDSLAHGTTETVIVQSLVESAEYQANLQFAEPG